MRLIIRLIQPIILTGITTIFVFFSIDPSYCSIIILGLIVLIILAWYFRTRLIKKRNLAKVMSTGIDLDFLFEENSNKFSSNKMINEYSEDGSYDDQSIIFDSSFTGSSEFDFFNSYGGESSEFSSSYKEEISVKKYISSSYISRSNNSGSYCSIDESKNTEESIKNNNHRYYNNLSESESSFYSEDESDFNEESNDHNNNKSYSDYNSNSLSGTEFSFFSCDGSEISEESNYNKNDINSFSGTEKSYYSDDSSDDNNDNNNNNNNKSDYTDESNYNSNISFQNSSNESVD
jgi:hypothetical protein